MALNASLAGWLEFAGEGVAGLSLILAVTALGLLAVRCVLGLVSRPATRVRCGRTRRRAATAGPAER